MRYAGISRSGSIVVAPLDAAPEHTVVLRNPIGRRTGHGMSSQSFLPAFRAVNAQHMLIELNKVAVFESSGFRRFKSATKCGPLCMFPACIWQVFDEAGKLPVHSFSQGVVSKPRINESE